MQFTTGHFKEFFGPLDTLNDIFEITSVARNDIIVEFLNQLFLSLLKLKHFNQSQSGNRILVVKFPRTLSHNEHELLGKIHKNLFFNCILVKHAFEQALVNQG